MVKFTISWSSINLFSHSISYKWDIFRWLYRERNNGIISILTTKRWNTKTSLFSFYIVIRICHIRISLWLKTDQSASLQFEINHISCKMAYKPPDVLKFIMAASPSHVLLWRSHFMCTLQLLVTLNKRGSGGKCTN